MRLLNPPKSFSESGFVSLGVHARRFLFVLFHIHVSSPAQLVLYQGRMHSSVSVWGHV